MSPTSEFLQKWTNKVGWPPSLQELIEEPLGIYWAWEEKNPERAHQVLGFASAMSRPSLWGRWIQIASLTDDGIRLRLPLSERMRWSRLPRWLRHRLFADASTIDELVRLGTEAYWSRLIPLHSEEESLLQEWHLKCKAPHRVVELKCGLSKEARDTIFYRLSLGERVFWELNWEFFDAHGMSCGTAEVKGSITPQSVHRALPPKAETDY